MTTFSTNDYTPFKDFSFYSINNSAYKIVAIGEDVPNYGSKSGNIIYTLKETDLGTDNSFSLSVGVMDALDTAVTSTLNISNLEYMQQVEEKMILVMINLPKAI